MSKKPVNFSDFNPFNLGEQESKIARGLTVNDSYGVVALAVDLSNEHTQIFLETKEKNWINGRSLDYRIRRIHIALPKENSSFVSSSFGQYFSSARARLIHDENFPISEVAIRQFRKFVYRVPKSTIEKIIINAQLSADRGINFSALQENCFVWSKDILQRSGIDVRNIPTLLKNVFNVTVPSHQITAEAEQENDKEQKTVQSNQNWEEGCNKFWSSIGYLIIGSVKFIGSSVFSATSNSEFSREQKNAVQLEENHESDQEFQNPRNVQQYPRTVSTNRYGLNNSNNPQNQHPRMILAPEPPLAYRR